MLIDVLLSLIAAVFCIGILIYSVIVLFAFADWITWIQSQIPPDMNMNTDDAKAALNNLGGVFIGIFTVFWIVFALGTCK